MDTKDTLTIFSKPAIRQTTCHYANQQSMFNYL